jgi:anti-sigma B factor antagonist
MVNFGVDVARPRGGVVVVVTGELDVATAPELDAALLAAEVGAEQVVVDLTRLSFLDSTGLKILVRSARRVGTPFTLVCPSDNRAVARVLGFAGFDDAFQVVEAVDQVPGLDG